MDNVGGIAKVTIRQDIAGGMFFTDAEDIVCHLSSKYAERQDPKYVVKNINTERLIAARLENKQFKYNTIDGSYAFQVAVFIPNSNFLKLPLIYAYARTAKLIMNRAHFLRNTTIMFRS